MERNAHEGALEIQNQGKVVFPFGQVVAEGGEVDPMIDASRQDLTLGQGNGAVDAVGSQVLDEAMLEAAVLLELGHVAERGGVALGSREGLRAGSVAKEERKSIVDLGFKQLPGGQSDARWGRVLRRRGRGRDLVEQGVVRDERGASVQDVHRVRLVHFYAGEVRPWSNETGQPHGSARTQPVPDSRVGVPSPEKDCADQLDPPGASWMVFVEDPRGTSNTRSSSWRMARMDAASGGERSGEGPQQRVRSRRSGDMTQARRRTSRT